MLWPDGRVVRRTPRLAGPGFALILQFIAAAWLQPDRAVAFAGFFVAEAPDHVQTRCLRTPAAQLPRKRREVLAAQSRQSPRCDGVSRRALPRFARSQLLRLCPAHDRARYPDPQRLQPRRHRPAGSLAVPIRPGAGTWIKMYLLVEHLSAHQRNIVPRSLGYVVEAYRLQERRWLERHDSLQRFLYEAVVPI